MSHVKAYALIISLHPENIAPNFSVPVVHENSNCFQNILKILRAIPEPYYPDIAFAFMEFR